MGLRDHVTTNSELTTESAFWAEGNSDLEDGPLIDLTLHRDLSVVVRNNLFGNGEPQSGSGRFGTEHEIENLEKILLRYPHAVVSDDDKHIFL
jgi:hypothetical protein